MPPSFFSRRHFLWRSCLSLLPLRALCAANESREIFPWTAGGKRYGPRPRQDNGAVEGDLSWLCSKMWSFYNKGRITYFRPGKDRPDHGEEVYWTKQNACVGTAGNRHIWVIELTEDPDKTGSAPALMFLMDEPGRTDGEPGTMSLFFFLAGGNGDHLTYTFDKGKDDTGRLMVKQKSPGEGAARSYEFVFEDDLPKLKAPTEPKKRK